MPVETSDVLWKLSIKTGSAGHSAAQGNPNASLGKYISTSQWAGGTLHDLFDVVSGAENAANTVDYRCVFIHNAHATLDMLAPVRLFIASQVAGGVAFAIAVDTTAASAIGASSAQALEIANETTAPAGLTFSAPTDYATGLDLGAIPPGQCKAVWIRRTAANTAAINNDGFTAELRWDTAP